MKTQVRVEFDRLIGNKYPLHLKMEILNWMLNTGKNHIHSYGWNIDGINKSILGYSANNYNHPACIPENYDVDIFFDALFARAVFLPPNKPLLEWRNEQSIDISRHRRLKFNTQIPEDGKYTVHYWIKKIYELRGCFLDKSYHHPDFKDRTKPKILSLSINTIGSGWNVQYEFSFSEFDYAPGWKKTYNQSENESVWEFLKRSCETIISTLDHE